MAPWNGPNKCVSSAVPQATMFPLATLLLLLRDAMVKSGWLARSVFDVEWSPNCRSDSVEISRGPQFSSGQLVGRYCGPQQPSRTTLRQAVWIRFRSNANNVTRRGFHASYVSSTCLYTRA